LPHIGTTPQRKGKDTCAKAASTDAGLKVLGGSVRVVLFVGSGRAQWPCPKSGISLMQTPFTSA
jgi:hypothetical protein